MALGRKCGGGLKGKRGGGGGAVNVEEGIGFVRYTRGLGRKRIAISNDSESSSPLDSALETPLKKQCSREINVDSERSLLESLPQDILIRVLCGVNHEDLEQLLHVSKSIREAASIAKQWHFAYSTPSKTRVFPKTIDFGDPSEIETPNAPKQSKSYRSRISGKKLADISVALFSSPDRESIGRRKDGFCKYY